MWYLSQWGWHLPPQQTIYIWQNQSLSLYPHLFTLSPSQTSKQKSGPPIIKHDRSLSTFVTDTQIWWTSINTPFDNFVLKIERELLFLLGIKTQISTSLRHKEGNLFKAVDRLVVETHKVTRTVSKCRFFLSILTWGKIAFTPNSLTSLRQIANRWLLMRNDARQ